MNCHLVISPSRRIASTLFVLAAFCAATHAQQMTIDRATEVYEKRLVAAEKAKTDDTAKTTAAYEDTVRRLNTDYITRIRTALRTAKDDEMNKLLDMLEVATGETKTEASQKTTAAPATLSNAELDELFEKLVGTWYTYSSTGTDSSKGAYTYTSSYEFKRPKLLLRSSKYVYTDRRYRDDVYTYGEHRARPRDGKIVFEETGNRSTNYGVQYEIPVPFDLNNLIIIRRTTDKGYSDRTETIRLTKDSKK